jgi:hypothetical protein
MRGMVTPKTWEEFRATKLLWWANRLLHTFGWAIVLEQEEDGSISSAYPARVRFRGFDEKSESEGFVGLTGWLAETAGELKEEVRDEGVEEGHISDDPREPEAASPKYETAKTDLW